MADVFISYADPEDKARASAVADAITGAGLTVWWGHHLRAGETFGVRIRKELDAAKCVVVLWSHASVNNRWVLSEAEEGAKREILVPIRIQDVRLPVGFNSLHTITFLDADAGFPATCLDAIAAVVRADESPLPPPPFTKEPQPVRPNAPTDLLDPDSGRTQGAPPPRRSSLPRTISVSAMVIALVVSWLLYEYLHQPRKTPSDPSSTQTSSTQTSSTATSSTETSSTETSSTQKPPPPDPLVALNERLSVIQEYLRQLNVIETSQLPNAFWGPIDTTAIGNEKHDWNEHLAKLSTLKDSCAAKTTDQDRLACVQGALRQVSAPKPLPPPGRVFPIAEKVYATDRVIDLHQPVPTPPQQPVPTLLIDNDTFTKPATVFVKGEWGGLPSLPCADIAVPYLVFKGTVSTFTLYDDEGRRIARRIVGHELPKARQNKRGAARTGGDVANLKDLAVMNGWPARTPLSAIFNTKYGRNSTACPYDHPYVLIWQNDSRINGRRDPYDVQELLIQ